MSFAADIERWTRKVKVANEAVFSGVVAETKNSIVFGSPLTGAPGQVVADVRGGELRASWQAEFETPTRALISTSVPWAQQNEDGVARPGGGPYEQRAAIGGRWNVALTRRGFANIVADVCNRLGFR
jgi:hypothetical protein